MEDLKKNERNMQLNNGAVDEYEQRNKAQQKKIKQLKASIHLLEQNLSQILQSLQDEKELLRFQHEQVLEQQRKEIGQLQGKMKKKVRRQRALKDLAGRILQQRSEVEQFFLEALEQIKEEIRKKLLLEKKRNFTAAQNERPKPLTADQSR